jgi:glycosyltransferase involved in cell wall biosynthesis
MPILGGRAGLLAWRKAMVLVSALPGDRSATLEWLARFVPPVQGMAQLAETLDVVDLVHVFNLSWEAPALVGRRFARQRGIPLVVTPFSHLGVGRGDRVSRNSTMDHQLRLLREAQAVLTLTAVEAAGLERLRVPRSQIYVVGAGLDLSSERELVASAVVLRRQRLSWPYVLFVGRNSYDKGAIHAARAVLYLRRQGMTVGLVLIGALTPEFRRFYRHLSAEQRQGICPLGLVLEDEKRALLSRCEMLVLPSRTDSFGMVLLEAWACGRPVVGARAGGIPGVIDEGENGLLVPFGDVAALVEAIASLLQNREMARSLGARGREKVLSYYTWEQVCQRTAAVYRILGDGVV